MRTLFIMMVMVVAYTLVLSNKKSSSRSDSPGIEKQDRIKLPDEITKITGVLVYIPSGSYSRNWTKTDKAKFSGELSSTVTLQAFLLGATEVTNSQYLLFVNEMNSIAGKDSASKLLPDTTSFKTGLGEITGSTYAEYYLRHPSYKNHPVVGVSWLQAKAYTRWINNRLDVLYQKNPDWQKKYHMNNFRLPSEAEWEYAAAGNYNTEGDLTVFSWGYKLFTSEKDNVVWSGKFGKIIDQEGLVIKGDLDEGEDIIAKSESYQPNDYGAYNLSGNVYEWTSSTANTLPFYFLHGDLNFSGGARFDFTDPVFKVYDDAYFDPSKDKKVLKGGSYLYGPSRCQITSSDTLAPQKSRCDIGFRVIMTYF